MFYLEIEHGGSPGRRRLKFERPRVTIGRDRSMDVSLEDATISRQSAVIIERGSQTFFQDVGGKNPVRVNGDVVVSCRLRDGDVISVGDYRITYRREDSEMDAANGGETVVDPRASIERWRAESSAPVDSGGGGAAAGRTLQFLQSFAELIQRLPDRERLFEAALAPAFELLDVKRSFIGLFGAAGLLDVVAEKNDGDADGRGYSRSIVERVRREKVAILFSEEVETPGRHESRSLLRLKIRSAMCVPILDEDEVRGVLYLDNRGRARSFTREDLHFANVLAHLISLAFDKEELYRRIRDENRSLKSILRKKHALVGVSPASRELQRRIRRAAAVDATVLLIGESGTGKELVARAIHDRSPRRDGPFVPVNCAAIPENLLESELFGYVPRSGIAGADPGGKAGKFEAADGGTLLLDEIGDMSLPLQAKILRILEDHVVERLGGGDSIAVDIRVIAATNKNLEREVGAGRFREDLFYRINVFQVLLPPLRDRVEDIIPIAQHFARTYAGESEIEISPRAREALLAYRWPGNVRELRNVMQNAVLLGSGKVISPENLPDEILRDENRRVLESLAEVEARHLQRVLESVNWNKSRAAEILGINRSTLYEKIKQYHLTRNGSG